MKVQYTLVSLIVICLTLFACTTNERLPQETVDTSPLRVSWTNWPGYYPLIIGVEKGFFEEQEVIVEPVFGEGNRTSALLAGKVEAALVTLGNVIQLEGEYPGSIQLVLPVDYSNGGDAFLASAEIKALTDLEGQTLGLIDSPFSPAFATVMLKEHGLSLQSVNRTNHRPSKALKLLDTGQAQAVHVFEPYLSQGVEQGYHVIYSSRETPGLIVDNLIFRTEVIQERPDDVQAFVNGWFATVEWWQANPEEGNAIIAKELEVSVDKISTEGVAILNHEQALRLFERDSTEVTSLYETSALYTEVMTKLGLLQRAPDLESLIDPSFME